VDAGLDSKTTATVLVLKTSQEETPFESIDKNMERREFSNKMLDQIWSRFSLFRASTWVFVVKFILRRERWVIQKTQRSLLRWKEGWRKKCSVL
jgi:hypothetical protein